jgi:hypothetical protein
VPVGTEHNYWGAYTEFTEDINVEIRQGDKIQVYAFTENPANPVFVKWLQMRGDYSYFEVTY